MYDFNDERDLASFKKRLQEARKKKGYTQDDFAEKCMFKSRSSVGNWESPKQPALPDLRDLVKICGLLDVDPNFLLGVSEVESTSDQAISEVIGLSRKNVNQLRTQKDVSRWIGHLMSCAELGELLRRMKQICYYEVLSEAQETTFTAEALKKIQKAFDAFYRNTFPLDMNAERFGEYVRKEFKWSSDKGSIEAFIAGSVTENEYANILFDHPDFACKSDAEKYEILIQDIAATSYDYLMGTPIIELARQEIAKALETVVARYIQAEVEAFRSRLHQRKG